MNRRPAKTVAAALSTRRRNSIFMSKTSPDIKVKMRAYTIRKCLVTQTAGFASPLAACSPRYPGLPVAAADGAEALQAIAATFHVLSQALERCSKTSNIERKKAFSYTGGLAANQRKKYAYASSRITTTFCPCNRSERFIPIFNFL